MADTPDQRSPIIVEDETLRAGFTAIPNYIMRHPKIKPGAKLAYFVLLSYAWQQDSCFPGQDRMAEDMGVDRRSIIRYIQELVAAGLVRVDRRGLGQTNVYTLLRWQESRSDNLSHQEVTKTTHQEVPKSHTKKTQVKTTQQNGYRSKKDQRSDTYDEHEHQRRIIESAQRAGFSIPGEE